MCEAWGSACTGSSAQGHLQGQPHGVAVLLQRVQLQGLPEVAAAGRLVLQLTADAHLHAVKLDLDRGHRQVAVSKALGPRSTHSGEQHKEGGKVSG